MLKCRCPVVGLSFITSVFESQLWAYAGPCCRRGRFFLCLWCVAGWTEPPTGATEVRRVAAHLVTSLHTAIGAVLLPGARFLQLLKKVIDLAVPGVLPAHPILPPEGAAVGAEFTLTHGSSLLSQWPGGALAEGRWRAPGRAWPAPPATPL